MIIVILGPEGTGIKNLGSYLISCDSARGTVYSQSVQPASTGNFACIEMLGGRKRVREERKLPWQTKFPNGRNWDAGKGRERERKK